jgi:hypothetical protein
MPGAERCRVFSRGERIGTFTAVGLDEGMGVVIGRFEPNSRYAEIAPLLQKISEMLHASAALSEDLLEERDHLALRLAANSGEWLETSWVMIYDFSDSGARELEAQLLNRGQQQAHFSGLGGRRVDK